MPRLAWILHIMSHPLPFDRSFRYSKCRSNVIIPDRIEELSARHTYPSESGSTRRPNSKMHPHNVTIYIYKSWFFITPSRLPVPILFFFYRIDDL